MRFPVVLFAALGAAACSSTSDTSATLVLNNPYWDRVNVEAVITKSTDCNNRGSGYVATKEFVMVKNRTQKIEAPNAEIICWRHDRNPNNPTRGDWSGWSKVTPFPGQETEADL
jgi:hypothetical protein